MRSPCWLLASLLSVEVVAVADDEPVMLGEVFVTGAFPGPGLWKVTHPSHDNVLWIVAQPPLLPPGMRWNTDEIERVAAQSQLIVLGQGLGVVPDGKVGTWRMLTLAPSVLSARRNPGGQRLEEILSPELHARWREQKLRVMGNDRSIEKWRPLFAGERLRHEAIKGLTDSAGQGLTSMLWRVAKDKGIKKTYAPVTVKVPADQLRKIIKRFVSTPLDDLECFRRNVDYVAALADEHGTRLRARAWATGDLETLRSIPPMPAFQQACDAALLSSEAARPYFSGDLKEQLDAAWFKVVEESMTANDSTLAVLPLDELLWTTGRLAELRSKGYVVEEP